MVKKTYDERCAEKRQTTETEIKKERPKSFSHLYFLNRKRESCEKAARDGREDSGDK